MAGKLGELVLGPMRLVSVYSAREALDKTEDRGGGLVSALEVEYRESGEPVPTLMLAHAVDVLCVSRLRRHSRTAARWAEAAVRHLDVAGAADSVRSTLRFEEVEAGLRSPPHVDTGGDLDEAVLGF